MSGSSGRGGVAPRRELLLANHRFPGEYIVKAFGPAVDRFVDQIRNCAIDVVGEARATFDERLSRRGSRICLTVTLHAESVDEVIGVYDRMHQVEDLMLIL
jgi:putative lipoic acid-binding regulatory protein